MDKQIRINRLTDQLDMQIASFEMQVDRLQKRKDKLYQIAARLDDPHALVPNSVKSIEDWLVDHPFPNAVLASIYINRFKAYEASLYSYTTMHDYHIVKCESAEYYRNKFNIKNNGY